MMRRPRRTEWIVLGLALLACLGIAEAVLRGLGYSYPAFAAWAPERGRALRPGAEGWWTSEGRAYVRINQDGFRDRDHALDKGQGVYRIAVLGDSFSEAFQVPVDSTYWAILERELLDHVKAGEADPHWLPGLRESKAVEVLNFGVSGYGTAHELLVLRGEVWKYTPDLILLQIFPVNDICDNGADFSVPWSPVFELKDGAPVLDRGFLDHPPLRGRYPRLFRVADRVRNRSRVVQLAWEFQNRLRGPRFRDFYYEWPGEPTRYGVDPLVYLPPPDSSRIQAWQMTEALLVTMSQEVAARGASYLTFGVGAPDQVAPGADTRRALATCLGVRNLDYADDRIGALARRAGFWYLPLAGGMAEAAEGTGVFFHGFGDRQGLGHWNERGHRIAATLLAEWLAGGTECDPKPCMGAETTARAW